MEVEINEQQAAFMIDLERRPGAIPTLGATTRFDPVAPHELDWRP
jgi:hypothetical protein